METDLGDVIKKSASHHGRGKGSARVVFGGSDETDNTPVGVTVPYKFEHSPDGPKLSFKWDQTGIESDVDLEYDGDLPEQAEEAVLSLSTEAKKQANY